MSVGTVTAGKHEFKINFIVWKRITSTGSTSQQQWFKINFIVWKPLTVALA